LRKTLRMVYVVQEIAAVAAGEAGTTPAHGDVKAYRVESLCSKPEQS